MKVLTIKQPWATLICKDIKGLNLEVGKQNTEANC